MGEALDSQSKQTKTEPEGKSGEPSECQVEVSREMECAGAGGQTGVCRVPRSRGQDTQLADSKSRDLKAAWNRDRWWVLQDGGTQKLTAQG